jgi:3-phenylpropionate/trans-cinnamate dioxygenase ferredoxin subunit
MCGGPILADDSAARWTAVCSLEHLRQRRIVCAKVDGVDLLVVQDGEQVTACERACPHEQADLSFGRVADGKLYCPRHLAWFGLRDGHISPGWPSRPLRRYPVRLADDTVWIDVETAAE